MKCECTHRSTISLDILLAFSLPFKYMLDHGYIGNYCAQDQITKPSYIDEQFVDAHEDEASLNDAYSSCESTITVSNIGPSSTICTPAILLPSCFPNLVYGCLNVPCFTNYAVDFVETLDYVFASTPSYQEPFGFRPKGEAPMPSAEMVKQYVAMPNEVMPSDHVAVVCDFEWATYHPNDVRQNNK